MSEQQNRESLEHYFQAFERQDLDAMEELLHDDYVEEYPQSGERIRGKDNRRKIECGEFGGKGERSGPTEDHPGSRQHRYGGRGASRIYPLPTE